MDTPGGSKGEGGSHKSAEAREKALKALFFKKSVELRRISRSIDNRARSVEHRADSRVNKPPTTHKSYDGRRFIKARVRNSSDSVVGQYLKRITGGNHDVPVTVAIPAMSRKLVHKESAANPLFTDNSNDFLEGQGIQLLRQQRFEDALLFFQQVSHEHPERSEGWLGVGAAMLAQGDANGGIEFLVKGSRGVGHSHAGELLTAVKLGGPEVWLRLARLCAQRRHSPSLICALSLVEACLRSPNISPALRSRASEEYYRYLGQLRVMKSKFASEAARYLDPSTLAPEASGAGGGGWVVALVALALALAGALYWVLFK